MAKVLFFGDIMGKPGRRALAQFLPLLRKEYSPDVVVANVENLAHGKGVTLGTMQELVDCGVDVFTSGNHVFDKGDLSKICFEKFPQLIRPDNYTGDYPGSGFYRIEKNGQHFLVANINGRVFFEKQFRGEMKNPFLAIDELLLEQSQKGDIIMVDFHAEATSEKIAMGWHLDGRVVALFGTHTHVATADYQILPKGTAYATDAGMTGSKHSVIGVKVENSLNVFLEKTDKFVMDVAESGPVMLNALVVETEGNKAIKIEKIYKEI